jgi:hypothetical protein
VLAEVIGMILETIGVYLCILDCMCVCVVCVCVCVCVYLRLCVCVCVCVNRRLAGRRGCEQAVSALQKKGHSVPTHVCGCARTPLVTDTVFAGDGVVSTASSRIRPHKSPTN